MDCAAVLRAARAVRRVSQRELAELAAVPRSTVDRIEGDRTVPRVDTMDRLLGAIGLELTVRTTVGRPLPIDDVDPVLRDRAGRHFPAHLPLDPMTSFGQGSNWWGWFRIAWTMRDPEVPRYTYTRRTGWIPPTVGDRNSAWRMCIWDDAT